MATRRKDWMMRLVGVVATAALFILSACAPPPVSTDRPGSVGLVVTDEIILRPDQKVHPEIASECEQLGMTCGIFEGGPDKAEFATGETVNFVVSASGLTPESRLVVEVQFFDPEGELFQRASVPTTVPSDWSYSGTLQHRFGIGIPRPGKWSVKVFVNGREEVTRSFDVL